MSLVVLPATGHCFQARRSCASSSSRHDTAGLRRHSLADFRPTSHRSYFRQPQRREPVPRTSGTFGLLSAAFVPQHDEVASPSLPQVKLLGNAPLISTFSAGILYCHGRLSP